MPGRFRNLVGQAFTRLTVLEYAGVRQFRNGRESQWKCRCVCGKELTVPQRYLVAKKNGVRSCGCLIGQHKRTHGMTGTRTFRSWEAMRRRCSDPKSRSFPGYGARGIKVCERWANSFENFLADMGERPEGKTLDRFPNNDGNYEPGNCRWATQRQQSNNRRSSHELTINGETLSLAEWERRNGLRVGCIAKRLSMGWSDEDAVRRGRRADPRLRPRDTEGAAASLTWRLA